MLIEVKVIVEARDKALLLRLACGPIVWLPRSAICYGDYLHGGETDLLLDIATYAYNEVMQALEMAKTMREGSRVIDAQFAIMQEKRARRAENG